ncbi:AraC family transcriptional regulator [uncultured Kriegella sp.]|uniref:AraC family transcriptional regulator n=1 Tax=uncultured Kriegella sp. TaxID=1798910 RepID=UPI0030DC33F4
MEEHDDAHFYDAVHFHEEYQLTHIVDGRGTLVVGQNSYPFRPGDSYLFGRNLPHVFKKEVESRADTKKVRAHHFSIFFSGDALVAFLNQVPESSSIHELLRCADCGLKLNKRQSSKLLSKMKRFQHLDDFDKLLGLLYMLEAISKSTNHTALTTSEFKNLHFDEYGTQKMTEIFNFIESNHSKKISLANIANRFNMNPSSFCRFFKSRTQKTFSQFLIEIRVARACELIREGAHNATETCFESGFTNLSNFHRQFKNVIGMTPTQYKNSVSTFLA